MLDQSYKQAQAKCVYCGDSPVNHNLAYISQSFSLLITPLVEKLTFLENKKFFIKLLDLVHRFYIHFSQKLKILWFGKNKADALTGRARVIWDEAEKRGIEMQQMIVYGKALEQYRAKINGDKWFYFESLPIPQHLPQASYDYIDDKVALKKVLSEAGICVPKSFSVKNEKEALEAFEKLNKPLIVKPRVGSRGRHTSVFINTKEELLNAFHIARRLCRYVAIEEYLFGPVCRATLVSGKVVGFFVGMPPYVVGDGIHTVQELINVKNKIRPERVEEIQINKEVSEYMMRQGYTIDSVLPANVKLTILFRTGRFFGGETRECLPAVHSKLKDYMERAVLAINVPVVGFDVIIPDPEIDPDTQKWGIIEANSLPFIDLHYYPLYGEPVNIAAHIWDLWKQN